MKVPPFDECQQCISTNEKAGFRAVNQWGALILTREIRGLDFYQSVRQCQICYLCNTKGYRRLAQLALSDNANCGFCVIWQVIPDLECTIGIVRQCQLWILCKPAGNTGPGVHNWHCQTMPNMQSVKHQQLSRTCTIGIVRQCQLWILCNLAGNTRPGVHNWHCQTMPIVDSV